MNCHGMSWDEATAKEAQSTTETVHFAWGGGGDMEETVLSRK